jgi:hypothetical protein
VDVGYDRIGDVFEEGGMARNTVFISYPSEDGIIADKVFEAISKMPGNGLRCFLDRVHIIGGARIPDSIRGALTDTIYFVAIGTNVTRRNFDWCGQELGFYQGAHLDEDRLETCLYEKAIPDLFKERKSYKAQALKKEHLDEFGFPILNVAKSEFYAFLKEIAKLNSDLHPPAQPDIYWSEISAWADTYCNQLTDSFFKALQTRVRDEWYPQGRVELSISNGDFYKERAPAIPIDTEVSLTGSTYSLFNASPPNVLRPLSWDVFTDYVKEKTGNDVLPHIVADVVINVLPDREQAKNDYVFQAPNGKFYRVLLVKHSVYGSKRRDFIFNLVESIEKVTGGDEETTTLAAAICLEDSSRWRRAARRCAQCKPSWVEWRGVNCKFVACGNR